MTRLWLILCLLCPLALAEDAPKPRIAFFPLGGDATAKDRDQVGFALRTKLDRTGTYDVIDGEKMKEVAGQAKGSISLATSSDDIVQLNSFLDASILVWGEMGEDGTVRLKALDLREGKGAQARQITRRIKQPTDRRFAVEEILQSLPGIRPFAHPPEESVVNDAQAQEMWKRLPNLVANGDFSQAGHWDAIYQSEKYPVQVSASLPALDKVSIYRLEQDGKTNNVLAMNLSRTCAENNGMACLSEAIEIAPHTRYRISFRYRSDGPTLHVFVKGYTDGKDIRGNKAQIECYKRQVPPSPPTHGQWVTVVDDLNPQNPAVPVKYLRVDLYAYLSPGTVMFDDVIVKPVGRQTHKADDAALKKPATRPEGK